MKLELQHKHCMKLIKRDADESGWTSVSETLSKLMEENMPSELVTFEKLEKGGRIRLTKEGDNILRAMDWL